MFKILNGYENIDSNIFFESKESKITKGHNYTLVKKQSRLDVRKYSFSQRTINVWNNLSTDCVHASSVNMFKNKIYKYLAISDLDGNTSCGLDGIYAEHLKLGSRLLFTLLGHCLTSFFVHGFLPESMIHNVLVPVIKSKTGRIMSKELQLQRN